MERIGEFYLDKEKVKLNINEQGNKTGVFSLKNDDGYLYIGGAKAQKTTLKDRLNRIRGKAGNGTNERICDEIMKILKQRKMVGIYAYYCSNYEGQEKKQELISKYSPVWNIKK